MKMSKSVMATLGLIFITFLAAIQYVFLSNVPDDISTFAFVCVTNVIGLIVLGAVCFKRIRKIGTTTLKKGIIFAVELTGFNFFVLMGSRSMDAVIISSVVSMYFIFITPLLLLLKKKTNLSSTVASVIAVIALMLMFGADTNALFSSVNVIYLVIADLFFAAYVVSVSILGQSEDSVQLTFSQMIFSALFALVGWVIESLITGKSMALPVSAGFWIGAIFMGIFIRALYGLIQLSCQKHVSALKASLIFASEILITLIMNPIMCRIFGNEYTPVTAFQVAGGIFFIIATLIIDENVMIRLGYEAPPEEDEVDENGNPVRRSSVANKVILTTLAFSVIALVLTTIICLSAIQFIRVSAISNSIELGENASDVSSTAMMSQLEEKISNQARDKTTLAEQKLASYSDGIMSAASYAHALYSNSGSYPSREVFRPVSENAGKWVMQRTLADKTISYDDLKYESYLLGNMEDVFKPIHEHNDNIATIYLATNEGLLISYDPNSDNGDAVGEGYFEYRDSSWYNMARELHEEGKPYAFTDTYQDSYGRGLTITCVAPIEDGNNEFAGCVCMDVLMKEINESMVNDGIVIPSAAILIDGKGTYIAGGEIDETSETMGSIFDADGDEALREAGERILSDESGVIKAGEGDQAEYIAFSTIGSTDWKLCIISPVSSVTEPAEVIRESIENNTDTVVDTVQQGIMMVIQGCLTLIDILMILMFLFVGKISRKISDPLKQLEKDVRSISDGNLDNRTAVDTDDEIGSLARSFNHMTDSLQQYIADLTEATAKEERIAGELSIATNIQASMLPRNFTTFSDHKEFELYATMNPAKEVGGDFYDFFLVDDDHLALVMADVSGKGVPAALFMVRAKTLIKNGAQMGSSPAEILSFANEQLCEGNEAELFVTVWLAIIEISTGKAMVANAGHEHPALKRAGGEWELVKYRHGPAVATMEGIPFREHEFEIHPGDVLYVYTDGVPEATDTNDQLFGDERMIESLNSHGDASPEDLLRGVKEDIDAFVGEAPQFDDITMLGLVWKG